MGKGGAGRGFPLPGKGQGPGEIRDRFPAMEDIGKAPLHRCLGEGSLPFDCESAPRAEGPIGHGFQPGKLLPGSGDEMFECGMQGRGLDLHLDRKRLQPALEDKCVPGGPRSMGGDLSPSGELCLEQELLSQFTVGGYSEERALWPGETFCRNLRSTRPLRGLLEDVFQIHPECLNGAGQAEAGNEGKLGEVEHAISESYGDGSAFIGPHFEVACMAVHQGVQGGCPVPGKVQRDVIHREVGKECGPAQGDVFFLPLQVQVLAAQIFRTKGIGLQCPDEDCGGSGGMSERLQGQLERHGFRTSEGDIDVLCRDLNRQDMSSDPAEHGAKFAQRGKRKLGVLPGTGAGLENDHDPIDREGVDLLSEQVPHLIPERDFLELEPFQFAGA